MIPLISRHHHDERRNPKRTPVGNSGGSRTTRVWNPPEKRTRGGRFWREDDGVRADRLVAILLLLQRRGQVTAAEVAHELEVSERTARRDLEALGMAGLPVYSVRGKGGGYRMLGDGRTDLSGLAEPEVRALFAVAGPAAVTPEVRAALRKLVRALPEPMRDTAEAASRSMLFDGSEWGQRDAGRAAPVHLPAIQQAVIDRTRLHLGYGDRQGNVTSRPVDPYGLVGKAGQWYLVAGTEAGQRTFRVDRVRVVEPTGERFELPADFDLATAWADISDEVERRRLPAAAQVRIDPEWLGLVRWVLGARLSIGAADDDGWVHAEVHAQGIEALVGDIAGFAGELEVLSPPEVRDALAELGRELVDRYGDATSGQRDAGQQRRRQAKRTG
jgi:predicted DNA-binding transcriptional regulator YafY